MPRIWLPVLLLLSLSDMASAEGRSLTFKQTLELALDSAPSLLAAKQNLVVRELERANSFATLLPSLDLSAVHGLQRSILPTGMARPTEPWASQLRASLTQNFYDNGRSLTQIKLSQLNEKLGSLAYQRARDGLLLAVAEAYFLFSQNAALLETRRQQKEILGKQFKSLSHQYRQGLKTKKDFIRMKTDVQRSELDIISAQSQVTQSAIELRRLVGLETELSEFQPMLAEKLPVPLDALPTARPETEVLYEKKVANIENQINDASVSLVKREYWPRLSLSADTTYGNANYLTSSSAFPVGNELSWNLSLTMSYNLWDWGVRRRNVGIAEARRDILNSASRDAVLTGISSAAAASENLGRLKTNYAMNQELLSLEEENYNFLEAEYRQGKIGYLDLITSFRSFLDAKNRFYIAHFDLLRELSRYRFHEGNLLGTLKDF